MIVKKLNAPEGALDLTGGESVSVDMDAPILEPGDTPITENPDGTVTVDLGGDDDVLELTPPGLHTDNLVDLLDEPALQKIAADVIKRFESDLDSSREWFDMVADGMSALGLKIEEKSEPWEGACSSKHPLLLESVVKYQAKARSQLLPAGGPVRTEVIGLRTPEKLERATRVRQFMNYQITETMEEYVREHDRMLFAQGFAGMAFTKMWYDASMQRPRCCYVRADDFIVNYYATDLATAECYTHRIQMSKNELRRYQLAGVYADIELSDPSQEPDNPVRQEEDDIEGRAPPSDTDDQRYVILEQHVLADIPGFEDQDDLGPTGLLLPYIISVEKTTSKVLAIRRNWKEGDPQKKKCLYFVDWPLVPGFGFYGYGYLHLIGALAKTATQTWQQLVDGGTLANMQGGFVTRGTRISEPDSPIGPGVWKAVTAGSSDLKTAIYPFQYKEPSQTLLALLEKAVEWGKNLADNTEAVIAESTNYGPVGTTMALLDASGKLFSAIHERLFESQKKELRILAKLNAEYMPDEYPYDVIGGNRFILRSDFNDFVDVQPVTNPKTPSEAHRLAKANAQWSIAKEAPQEHNIREVLYDVYVAMGTDDPNRLLKPQPPQAQPLDPITENMIALQNLPLKAGPEQDHAAHVAVHMTFAQNPVYQQNPIAVQALGAHIQEHLALKYRQEMEMIMGIQLPPMGTPLPPQIENAIASKAAQASAIILQKDIIAAKEGQFGQQDPMVAIAQGELKLKETEIELKAKNNEIEHRLKQLELTLEHEDRLRQQDMDLREVEIKTAGRVKERNVMANAEIIKTQITDNAQPSEEPKVNTDPNVAG